MADAWFERADNLLILRTFNHYDPFNIPYVLDEDDDNNNGNGEGLRRRQ